jgi:hypothetical protein
LRGNAGRGAAQDELLDLARRRVGAAHNIVIDSRAISSKTRAGSTFRMQTCVPPTAVTSG